MNRRILNMQRKVLEDPRNTWELGKRGGVMAITSLHTSYILIAAEWKRFGFILVHLSLWHNKLAIEDKTLKEACLGAIAYYVTIACKILFFSISLEPRVWRSSIFTKVLSPNTTISLKHAFLFFFLHAPINRSFWPHVKNVSINNCIFLLPRISW